MSSNCLLGLALADLVVVMNNGRIEQAGSPREVFDAPRTEFVARFMGGHNVIDIDGRKVRTAGTLHAGNRLCAEAEGVFILVDHERFAAHAVAHGADPSR